jgi:hypothetical protein
MNFRMTTGKTPVKERKSHLVSVLYFSTMILFAGSVSSATIVTFDNLSSSFGGARIPNGYQSLNWSNFDTLDSILRSNQLGYLNGYNYGMITPSNVAFNAQGTSAEIDATATNFNFLSAYLTGAWNSNLNIQVQGFHAGNLLYDQTVVASATSATLFTFNYLNVDRLFFNSFGGQPAFGEIPEFQFAMDNFTFEFVPEPSAFLLTSAGALLLIAGFKRKRPK